jgi:hypothetical protein
MANALPLVTADFFASSCSRACPVTKKSTQKTFSNIENGDETEVIPLSVGSLG